MLTLRTLFRPAVLIALGPAAVCGQARVHLDVGAAVPTGAFAAVARPGPFVAAGLGLRPAGNGLGIGAEVSYARGAHDVGDAHSEVMGITAWAAYSLRAIGALDVEPSFGVGGRTHTRRSSDYPGLDSRRAGVTTDLGVRASMPIGRLNLSVVGRYVLALGALRAPAFPTDFMSVSAGVALPL